MTMHAPRYIVTDDSKRFPNVPPGLPQVRLHGTAGPHSECHGALVIGGTWSESMAGEWRRTDDGVWVLCEPWRTPQTMVSLRTPRCVRQWSTVEGSEPGHVWRIPVVLERIDSHREDAGWMSALDRVYGPNMALITDHHMEDVAYRLLAVGMGMPLEQLREDCEPDVDKRNAAMARLAMDLMCVGHHLWPAEILARGWLRESMVCDIIAHAIGVGATVDDGEVPA